jgi:hypothetical protein
MGVFICVWGRVDDTGLVPCWMSELHVSSRSMTNRENDNLQFLKQGSMSIRKPNSRNIGLVDIIPSRTG